MIFKSIKVLVVLVLVALLMSVAAYAETPSGTTPPTEVKVMGSGGFYSALEALAPLYEQKTGSKVVLISGPSMGSSPDAIPARLKRGEDADVVILAGSALDKLIQEGLVVTGSRTDLALSKIGVVVRAGAAKPDISTTDAVIRTLLAAKSIGYSDSASGAYLADELFPRLGIAEKIKDKSKRIVKDPVATWVARGDIEIGLQQVSELLPVPGVDFIGTLPDDIQKITVFSSGIAAGAKQAAEGEKFVQFLLSSEARPIITKLGLQPAK